MHRILYVEDEPLIAMGLGLSLEAAGFEVKTAPNGQRALALLDKGYRPDLIVTDYMMPVMDGPALIKAIRERPALGGIPILMVSAVPQHLLPEGIAYDGYLIKPFIDEQVIAEMRKLLADK